MGEIFKLLDFRKLRDHLGWVGCQLWRIGGNHLEHFIEKDCQAELKVRNIYVCYIINCDLRPGHSLISSIPSSTAGLYPLKEYFQYIWACYLSGMLIALLNNLHVESKIYLIEIFFVPVLPSVETKLMSCSTS